MAEDFSELVFPDLRSFSSYEEAARQTLRYLQSKYPFGLWMVTRTIKDDWIVLQSENTAYRVQDGDVFRWSDSFCSRMVRNEGPRIAPDSREVDAYKNAPINEGMEIGSYIGYPLTNSDGSLFGTLCAIDPEPRSTQLIDEDPLFRLLAQYISLAIEGEMRSLHLRQRIDQLLDQAHRDPMTGLMNRRGWEQLLQSQEEKCRILGEPAAVIMIDLDNLKKLNDREGHEAGDRYINAAAQALIDATRRNDALARLGGDEFGILIESSIAEDPTPLLERIRSNMKLAGVSASIGWSGRAPGCSLADAVNEADQAMYRDKAKRKSSRN